MTTEQTHSKKTLEEQLADVRSEIAEDRDTLNNPKANVDEQLGAAIRLLSHPIWENSIRIGIRYRATRKTFNPS